MDCFVRLSRLLCVVGICATVTFFTPQTLACGLFIGAESTPATMDAQRALMVFREATIQLHVQVVATDTQGEMSWLIPVPALPEVGVGDNAIFDALDTLTTPTVHGHQDASHVGGTGCEGDAKSGANLFGAGGAEQVTPIRSGQVGNYTYDIVQATDSEELVLWLQEAGYAVSEDATKALEDYVNQGWTIVSARLSDGLDPSEAVQLAPLVLTIPRPISSQIVYPLGLSRFSSVEVMPTVFYVLADKRYRVTNYGTTDLQGLANRYGEAPEELTYDATVDLLTEESGGRLIVTEFARDLQAIESLPAPVSELMDEHAFYLTRMYGRTRPESLVDANFIFAKDAPEVLPVADAEPMTHHATLAYVLLLFALVLVGLRRYTPSYGEKQQ